MRYCLGSPKDLGNIWAALAFMPFGLLFDFMDGKVARWRGKSSLMGQELDSLADLVCGISHFRCSRRSLLDTVRGRLAACAPKALSSVYSSSNLFAPRWI
jgi:hypothetical protein